MITKRMMAAGLTLFVLGVFSFWRMEPCAYSCTGVMLRNADGTIVHGRTLEFGLVVESMVAVVPRGYEFVGKAPGGPGMKYKSKYGAVGTITFNDVAICDGLNEKGLAIGAFYFPTFAKYAEITNDNRAKALSPMDFPNWILTQFATIGEVRSAIQNGEAVVAPTVLEGWGPTAPPLHYVVYDKTGASIVIEPTDGILKVFDNPIGVLTNSPAFDWHITNLRNYIALNPRNVPPVEIDGVKLRALGQGSGMLGLPGDFTPPSRFVRVSVFGATAIPSPNSDQGILQVFHILNNFDIPVGVAREVEKGIIHSDFTQFTAARDPQTLRYYYRTYDDQTIRMVDLRKFDLNAKEVKKLSTKSTQPVVDMSSEVK
jgi:choloylglycine hydrolase